MNTNTNSQPADPAASVKSGMRIECLVLEVRAPVKLLNACVAAQTAHAQFLNSYGPAVLLSFGRRTLSELAAVGSAIDAIADIACQLAPKNAPTASDPALQAFQPVVEELARATAKFPTWPTDPLHAVAVLQEEVGELTKAVLQNTYEPQKSARPDVRQEALQVAAMALRFVASLDQYEYTRCPQHQQKPAGEAGPR